jgi:hypothetical protein
MGANGQGNVYEEGGSVSRDQKSDVGSQREFISPRGKIKRKIRSKSRKRIKSRSKIK